MEKPPITIVVARAQSYGSFEPSLRVVEPVGEQGNTAELKHSRIVLGILGDDARVDVAGFGKLPSLEELRRRIGARLVRLGRRLPWKTRRDNQDERDADAGKFHFVSLMS